MNKYLAVFIGLTIGNFIYAICSKNYSAAFDRSFFQGIALLIAWLS